MQETNLSLFLSTYPNVAESELKLVKLSLPFRMRVWRLGQLVLQKVPSIWLLSHHFLFFCSWVRLWSEMGKGKEVGRNHDLSVSHYVFTQVGNTLVYSSRCTGIVRFDCREI